MDNNNQNSRTDNTPGTPIVKTVVQNTEPLVQRTETVTDHVTPVVLNAQPITRQTETRNTHTEHNSAKNIVATAFGLIEILIGFRFVLKLFGANPESGFAKFIYTLTGFFVNLFQGIFASVNIGGNGSKAFFEPASILAMIVVGLLAWLVFRLMTPKSDQHVDKTSFTSSADNNRR